MALRVVILSECKPGGFSFAEAVASRLGSLSSQITLQEISPEALKESPAPQGLLKQVQEAEVVIADPPLIAPFLSHLKALKWLHSTYAGVNHVVRELKRQGVSAPFQMTRLAGYLGPPMAEYVMGQIISQERGFKTFAAEQARKVWAKRPYRPLSQLTLGVLGATGDIGSCIASSAGAFGMRVVGYARRSRPEPVSHTSSMFYGPESLPDFLRGLDYLVSVLPSTKDTAGLLGGGMLRHCSDCVLINVGRGDLVDEDSIVEALEAGWLRHAVLDVFPVEPLPQSSRLWEHKDVTITPHVSAVTFPEHVVDSAATNLQRYLSSEPLRHVVDLEREY